MDYLDMMPFELKVKIFSYLDSFDLIQLRKVYTDWDDVLFSKSLIKNLNFYKAYRLDGEFHNFVLRRIRAECVTSLNINGCYWIDLLTLQKSIGSLWSLERLYVIETKFNFTERNLSILLRLMSLRRLAITTDVYEGSLHFMIRVPKWITRLYLHCLVPSVYNFIHHLEYLEELWIIFTNENFQEEARRLIHLVPSLAKRVMFSGSHTIPCFRSTVHKKICTFSCSRDNTQMYYELSNSSTQDKSDNIWCPQDPNWEMFTERSHWTPFGVADYRKLALNQTTLEEILFEELNLRHRVDLCSMLRRSAAFKIILSRNATKLKKLSFNFCLCASLVKNLVIGAEPSYERAELGLEDIANNCPLVNELEIWECRNADYTFPVISLSSITKFYYLRKLTLSGIPNTVDCEFLVDVCKKCIHLSSLRIDSQEQNNVLNYYLCVALPYTSCLVDLRYEQPNPKIDKLFESLGKIKNGQLQRLVIKTLKMEIISERSLRSFLDIHKNLCFVYLYIEAIVEPALSFVRRTLDRYSSNNKKKIFVVSNKNFEAPSELELLSIHLHEMVNLKTFVSVVDIFNGFR